jgi:hypothetical protein
MALNYFVTKFYSFPRMDKTLLKEFTLREDVDKWVLTVILIPIDESEPFLMLVTTNNLSIFDKVEDELGATEIEFEQYGRAAKRVGTKYDFFYPSADISSLF